MAGPFSPGDPGHVAEHNRILSEIEAKLAIPREIFETASGTWSDDPPSGRTDLVDTIRFVGVHFPTDLSTGVDTPANIIQGDSFLKLDSYI